MLKVKMGNFQGGHRMKIHMNGIHFNYNKNLSSGYYSLNGWFKLRSTNNCQYNFDDKGRIFFNNL